MGFEKGIIEINSTGTDVTASGKINSKSETNFAESKNYTDTEEILKISSFLKKTINANVSQSDLVARESEKLYKSKGFSLSEGNSINVWKNIENISSRVIEFNEDIVVLECLIDKELREYEEREFEREDFQNFELSVGKLFKLCWFRRDNQVMMEIKDNPKLIGDDDFPKTDFASKFSHIKLRK